MEDILRDRQMPTIIRAQESGWIKITCGVSQGSVLSPIMFLLYINGMVEGSNSYYTSVFADNANVSRGKTGLPKVSGRH